MRKFLAALLALSLLLSAAGALAEAADESEALNIASIAPAGGVFYALNLPSGDALSLLLFDPQTRASESLGVVADGGAGVTEAQIAALLTDERPVALNALFSDGETLYGLCVATGTAYTLLDASGAFMPAALPARLDTSDFIVGDGGDASILTISALFLQDGLLCYQLQDDTTGQRLVRIGSIDFATGEKREYPIEYANYLCAYEDGKALLTILDQSKIYDATTGTTRKSVEFGALDLRSGAYEALGSLTCEGDYGVLTFNGMSYASGSIFYMLNGKVYGYDIASAQTRVSAYTGEGLTGGMNMRAHACVSGYYAQGGRDALVAYALDTEAVRKGALTIFGEYGTDAHKSFAKNYPDIPTDVAGNYQSDLESLTTAMVSGGDTYDVLLLSINYMPVPKLIAKGYCADLSGYPEIMSHLEGMDPRFIENMTVNGALYGVPVSTNSVSFGVYMEQWEELGLTEADLPKTLPELFDFIANWDYDYADDYPDLLLFDYGGDKMTLFTLMLYDYVYYCQRQGMELTFDTDVWRGLLNSLEKIDFSNLSASSSASDFHMGGSLFVMYASPTRLDFYKSVKYTPLALALADGLDPVIGVSTNVLVLNPRSARKEDALRYIANYADHVTASDRIVMFPDYNEPAENPFYPNAVKELERRIEDKRAAVDKADESNKAALQGELTALEENRAQMESYRYLIPEDVIRFYREKVSPWVVAAQSSTLLASDSQAVTEINKLLMQYLDGGIGQDQLIKELDQLLWMMRMEDQ